MASRSIEGPPASGPLPVFSAEIMHSLPPLGCVAVGGGGTGVRVDVAGTSVAVGGEVLVTVGVAERTIWILGHTGVSAVSPSVSTWIGAVGPVDDVPASLSTLAWLQYIPSGSSAEI